MKITKFIYPLLLLAACAQPMAPSGGDKDVTPPQLTKTTYKINNKNQITEFELHFNENITVNSKDENVFINPILNTKPKIINSNKTLIIKFDQPLESNINYTVDINTAIGDLNENNIGKYPTLNITNQNNPDSLKIQGKIIHATTIQSYKNIFLKLVNNKAEYLTKISADTFSIQKLPNTPFNAIVFEDANKNKIAEENEIIGHQKNFDNNKYLSIYTYPKIKEKITINQYNNLYQISGIEKYKLPIIQYNINNSLIYNDTLYTLNTKQKPDSLIFNKENYLLQNNLLNNSKKFKTILIKLDNYTDSNTYLQIVINNKIQQINNLKIISSKDSNKKYSYEIVDKKTLDEYEFYKIKLSENPYSNYITELYSKTDTAKNNQIKNTFTPNNYGITTFKNTITDKKIKLLLIENNIIKYISPILNTEEEYHFYFTEGKYKLVIFEDANDNNILDAPNQNNRLSGESIIQTKEQFLVKKSLENITIITSN